MVAVGTAVVEMVVAVVSTVVAVASMVVAIVAEVDNRSEVVGSWAVVAGIVDIAEMGLVAVALCIPLTT